MSGIRRSQSTKTMNTGKDGSSNYTGHGQGAAAGDRTQVQQGDKNFSKYNMGGSARRSNFGGGKRSSVISLSSVNTDYEKDYRLYDFQKNSLANAITQLENIMKDSRDYGSFLPFFFYF